MKHYLNKFGEVTFSGNNDSRLMREPTEFETELLERIEELEKEIGKLEKEIESLGGNSKTWRDSIHVY